MTGAELQLLTKEVSDVINEALTLRDAKIAALTDAGTVRDAKIAALERRLAMLEAKPSVKFTGTFEPGRTYQSGDAAVHAGSLWICKAQTTGKPGEDFVGWQLAVKRGTAT